MDVSASFLSVKENIKEAIEKLDKTTIKYFHIDIMDGQFVKEKTWNIEKIEYFLGNTKKLRDVHLMVKDVDKYIDDFIQIKPEFITFHLEATDKIEKTIEYIKSHNIKAGLSIKPHTPLETLNPYLKSLDLVLIMSVEPGKGGQPFIENATERIDTLKKIKDEQNYHYLIEVDGGINDTTIDKVKNADIIVVGSFITNSNNYQEQINKLGI